VQHAYSRAKTPAYHPKPAYLAAKTLNHMLAGCRFQRRLAVGGPDNYVMQFAKGDEVRLVAWTIAALPSTIIIPVLPGRYAVTGHTGEALPALAADSNGLSVVLTDAPTYLVLERSN